MNTIAELDQWVWLVVPLLPIGNALVHHPTADTKTRVLFSLIGSIIVAIAEAGSFEPEAWYTAAVMIFVAQYAAFKAQDGLLGSGKRLNDSMGDSGIGRMVEAEDF